MTDVSASLTPVERDAPTLEADRLGAVDLAIVVPVHKAALADADPRLKVIPAFRAPRPR